MSLYKGNQATEASGGNSFSPGIYKFKVVGASLTDWGAVNFELETKDEAGNAGPKVYDSLKLNSESQAMKDEIDRRLTTMLGKPEIDSPDDIVGKVGYVVLQQGHKFLKPCPFGGYYDANKKSATGNADSISKKLEQALNYDWKQDEWEVKKANESQGHLADMAAPVSPENDTDAPF